MKTTTITYSMNGRNMYVENFNGLLGGGEEERWKWKSKRVISHFVFC